MDRELEGNIRMVGLDLDGTLLTGRKTITARTREVLLACARRGIAVVPVTGRPAAGIPGCVWDLPGIRYAITSNGANTYDYGEGGRALPRDPDPQAPGFYRYESRAAALLRKGHLPRESALKVLDCARRAEEAALSEPAAGEEIPESEEERRLSVQSGGINSSFGGPAQIREVFVRGMGYHDPQGHELICAKYEGTPLAPYMAASRRCVADLWDLVRSGPGHVENISLMCTSRAQRERIREALQGDPELSIILASPTNLEITDVRANKGEALVELGASLGIGREEIMAIGDSDNDRGLLAHAGVAVAMGNATEQIRGLADFVTADNEHDGAAEAIVRCVPGLMD